MPRKSKREIESAIEEIDGGEIADDVGIIEQFVSDDYPDPPREALKQAWVNDLRPDNDAKE